MKYVITFDSVHFAMKAEKILKPEGINVRLIPTPRKISSDCGMALQVQPKDPARILEILKNRGCRTTGFHKLAHNS